MTWLICLCLVNMAIMNWVDESWGEEPVIAPWFGNHDAAISLRFDDAFDSHVRFVVPLLNQYGFKATFMVNPGRSRYIKFREFWEKELPRMGYHLGNHTMHHHGARSIEEAEYEIGEASRRIRKVAPDQGRLLVFAAGGGEKWGGRDWYTAFPEYRDLVRKHELIDLYDGNHPSRHVDSRDTAGQLCELVQDAIRERKLQAFIFHGIGRPSVKDVVKFLLWGYHLTIDQSRFAQFVGCLDGARSHIWVAPLAQVYKYEKEFKSAKIEIVEQRRTLWKIRVRIGTDPRLYDQQLTLIIPLGAGKRVSKVTQGAEPIQQCSANGKRLLVDIRPIDSFVYIYFASERNH